MLQKLPVLMTQRVNSTHKWKTKFQQARVALQLETAFVCVCVRVREK